MKYWPQQLNFAVFCATQGCGVPREIFDSGINLPPADKSFLQIPRVFHSQANFVPGRRNSEHECFARRPAFQPIQ